MRQCLALLDGKFSRCVQSVEVLVIFIAGDGELVRHLLDIYWTLAGHLLDTCWTFTGHPRRRWVGTRIEYGQGAHVADRYGDGPTAEYAESAERASVVGIWETVAHMCGSVKCLNCDRGPRTACIGSWTWPSMRTGAGVRTGNADQNLAVVRHMAVNMLKQETTAKVGIKAKRKKAGWDYDYLLKDLST